MAAKASHAKGRVTKMTQKLRRAEARNKGLRTMLSQVVRQGFTEHTYIQTQHHTLIHSSYTHTLTSRSDKRQMRPPLLSKSVSPRQRLSTGS